MASACFGLFGLVLGGIYGGFQYSAAADAAARQGEPFVDELPVQIPIWAFMGAVVGAILEAIVAGILKRSIGRDDQGKA